MELRDGMVPDGVLVDLGLGVDDKWRSRGWVGAYLIAMSNCRK